MERPNDWNTVSPYSEYEPLELGGHICKVLQIKETQSKSNKPMLVIMLDIAEGEQKGYYKNRFDEDNRKEKKWGCVVYQLTTDNDGATSRGLKTFVDLVKSSNIGFNDENIWGDNFCSHFKGKLVGGVFGREQYETKDYELKFATKCVKFATTEAVRKGIEPPKDKLLEKPNTTPAYFNPSISQSNFSIGDFNAEFEEFDTEESDLPY